MAVRLLKQDAIGHVVLDRPPANSYDRAFLDELDTAIEEARRDDAVKAILVRSANEAMGKLETVPKVVVAAINGHCLGGGLEIALCCDFRIAAEGAYRIGLPEVTLGLLPGTGGTQRLPRLIGRQKALDLMLRGTTLTPQDALAAGVVDEVVPAGMLLDRALERTRAYATGPTYAIGQIKLAAVQGYGMRLDEGLKLEREALIRLFGSEDAREGVTAFVEKRKPNYKGK